MTPLFATARAVALLTAGLLVAGCASAPIVVAAKPGPFDARVLPECSHACACDAPPSVITTDPYSAPNAAVREHDLRKVCVAQCEARRKACADALDRARQAGAIKRGTD